MELPKKVNLNGADCFHLVLERNIAKHKIGNNIIRMVVTLKSENTLNTIENHIHNSPLMIWIANIQLKLPFFLHPYWNYLASGKRLEIEKLDGKFSEIPAKIISHNFNIKTDQLIKFHTYKTEEDELKLVMSFHHILMDGRGSGLIMRHITGNLPIENRNLASIFPKPYVRVNFFKHVVNMFRVKRFVEETMKKPVAIASKTPSDRTKFNICTITYSLDETEKIDFNAVRNGSRFGSNLYQIACTAHAVKTLSNSESPIWVPIPYDGRKRGSNGPIISNNISFLFYRLKITKSTTIAETISSIHSQLSDQLRMEMPKKHIQLLEFMRFIPKRFYYWMTTYAGRGEISSFLYTSAGESLWDTNRFSDELTDTLLIPPFTYPPGISVNFLRYDGKLKMNIVASDNKIDLKNLYLFEAHLKELLLNGDPSSK